MTASLSEPARVGEGHKISARSPSVGIPSKATGSQGFRLPLWELALQASWGQTLTTLLPKLQTYPWTKSPLHFYRTSGLLPLTSLFFSQLLIPSI